MKSYKQRLQMASMHYAELGTNLTPCHNDFV